MIKLNESQKKEIVELYLTDKINTCYVLAKKYNVSYSCINRLLLKNGIKLQPNIDLVNASENQIQICNDYKNNILVTNIAKKFNVSTAKIYEILQSNNIEIKHNYRKNNFNEKFFTSLTPEMYYFYGFCLGDASIQNDGSNNRQYNISIQLNNKDVNILEKFCEWVDYPKNKIQNLKTRNACNLIISGKEFILKNNDFFKTMGLVRNKTYDTVIPNISLDFFRYFLIGLIDADGCIQFNGGSKGYVYQIALTNNFFILNWVKEQLIKLGFSENQFFLRIYNRKENEIYGDLVICGKFNVIKFVKYLDLKSAPFFMERKWNKILLSDKFDVNYKGGQQIFSTREELENLNKLYDSGKGLTQKELGEMFNCSSHTIERALLYKGFYAKFKS